MLKTRSTFTDGRKLTFERIALHLEERQLVVVIWMCGCVGEREAASVEMLGDCD